MKREGLAMDTQWIVGKQKIQDLLDEAAAERLARSAHDGEAAPAAEAAARQREMRPRPDHTGWAFRPAERRSFERQGGNDPCVEPC